MNLVLFVAGIFRDTFSSLSTVITDVLYPVPDCLSGDQLATESSLDGLVPADAKTVFLSINRYERKKNIRLAIEALCKYCFSVIVIVNIISNTIINHAA